MIAFSMFQLSTSCAWKFLHELVELDLPLIVGSLIFLAGLPVGPRLFLMRRELPLAEHQLAAPP